MSSDDRNNKPKEGGEATDSGTPSFTLPDMEDVKGAPSSLRSGIHQGCKWTVNTANSFLSQLEVTTKSVQKPVMSAVEEGEKYGTQVATHCRVAYERRHEFAPYYVAGATFTVGGVTALRRGKIPAVLLGSLAGGITYLALYEPILEHAPSIEWPFKNLTGSLGGGTASGDDKKE